MSHDRNKAKILVVGTFDERGMPTGWTFDCNGLSWDINNPDCIEPLIELGNVVEDVPSIAGWTVSELREYARVHGDE